MPYKSALLNIKKSILMDAPLSKTVVFTLEIFVI